MNSPPLFLGQLTTLAHIYIYFSTFQWDSKDLIAGSMGV
jgi:hypothetical protein